MLFVVCSTCQKVEFGRESDGSGEGGALGRCSLAKRSL